MSESLDFNEDQRDYLQEICNIGMGQAGESLSMLFEQYVTLSVPAIEIINAHELTPVLRRLIPAETISVVSQGFYTHITNPKFCGESLTVFSDTSFDNLAQLLEFDEEMTPEFEQEILLEISNIINGACLSGIAEQLSERFFNTPPSIIGQSIAVDNLLGNHKIKWAHALSIKIEYKVEKYSFQCDLLLLLPDNSIKYLQSILNKLLDEF
ncbi:hypothetical protein DS885_06130 [Psychromonas sp. B3M02]|uniref:hypothetical protein n=1 Tax=Psychromonas sp. B3M02 TaxID=2267226 RepID=UPI000DE8A028|nr:hypothetical protein [Psychromonas sp. B3M02]RBW46927.1 hypothetical protein DS885_06130 [Psychromonas sp. B3M02]